MPARACLHLAFLLAAANLAAPLEKWHHHPEGPAGVDNCPACLTAANLVAQAPQPAALPTPDVLCSVSPAACGTIPSLDLAPVHARAPPA